MCTPGACVICYGSHPPPIDSGCGCRAGNELAHPDCLVKWACFQHAHRGWIVWDACQTCKRSFGGNMRNLLATARVLHVTNPRHPNMHWFFEQLPAIRNALALSEILMTNEKYTEAEQTTRALLSPIKRLLGYRDILYLQCEANLAISQAYTGKVAESNWRFTKVIRTLESVCFLGDWMTLSVRLHYTGSLLRQLKTDRYSNTTHNVLRNTRRVFGEHHVTTMACIADLATHISRVVRSRSYTVTTLVMRVFSGMSDLATSLSLHAQFAEAESLYTALLGAQELVLGTLHSQTVETRRNVIACKVARNTQVAVGTLVVQNESERRSLPSRHRGMHRNKLHQIRRTEMMRRRLLVTTHTSVTTKAPNPTRVKTSHGNVDSHDYTYTFSYTYTHRSPILHNNTDTHAV